VKLVQIFVRKGLSRRDSSTSISIDRYEATIVLDVVIQAMALPSVQPGGIISICAPRPLEMAYVESVDCI
jgi:hypothetical protein